MRSRHSVRDTNASSSPSAQSPGVPSTYELPGGADVRALLCGMRGSTPAPGMEYAEVGGNTSCVAIPAAGGRWLILDAGTGLARMARVLDGAPLRGSILLTHLHWDHTHGLPFLPNADRDGAEVDVLLPAEYEGAAALDVMARAMSPPHFPITPDGLQGHMAVRVARAGAPRPRRVHGHGGGDPAQGRSHVRLPGRGPQRRAWRTCRTTACGSPRRSGGPPRMTWSAGSTCCSTAPATSRTNERSPTTSPTRPSTTRSSWRRPAPSAGWC